MTDPFIALARSINADLAAQCQLEVGKIVDHPDHGRVKIVSGCFLDPKYGRVSNHWDWLRVDQHDRTHGALEHGYGWM